MARAFIVSTMTISTKPAAAALISKAGSGREVQLKIWIGITVKGDEKALAEMLGLLDIGYRGYAGFELCHPLPVVNGKTVGIDFVDKNSQLAAEYMRGILAEAKRKHGTAS